MNGCSTRLITRVTVEGYKGYQLIVNGGEEWKRFGWCLTACYIVLGPTGLPKWRAQGLHHRFKLGFWMIHIYKNNHHPMTHLHAAYRRES